MATIDRDWEVFFGSKRHKADWAGQFFRINNKMDLCIFNHDNKENFSKEKFMNEIKDWYEN